MNILLLNYNTSKEDKYDLANNIRENLAMGNLSGKISNSDIWINLNSYPIYPPNHIHFPVTLFIQNLVSRNMYDAVNIHFDEPGNTE